MRMRKRNIEFIGVFKRKIRKEHFEQYCETFELEADAAKKDLRFRGYHVMSN